jgi:hypothetical protein
VSYFARSVSLGDLDGPCFVEETAIPADPVKGAGLLLGSGDDGCPLLTLCTRAALQMAMVWGWICLR